MGESQVLRFYVYLPMPLAAAPGADGGEEAEWELLDRRKLRLVRCKPAPSKSQRSF